jgi:coproporphyrinogen III oxidase
MPPHASWSYQREDAPGTPERALLEQFLVPRDWL